MRLILFFLLSLGLWSGLSAQCLDPDLDAELSILYGCDLEPTGLLTITANNTSDLYFLEFTDLDDGFTGGFSYPSAGEYEVPLQPGSYFVRLYDLNGCEVELGNVGVDNFNASITSFQYTAPLCAGGNNGTASVVIEGGTPPFAYEWSTGSTVAAPDDLPFLSYISVTVTDANGCTTFFEQSILEDPPLPIQVEMVQFVEPSCGGGTDGVLAVSGIGGVEPYAYEWGNGATTAAITGLPAGNYPLTVTDASGCMVDTLIILTEGVNATITASNDGVIDCDVSSVTLDVSPPGPEIGFNWTGPGVDGANTSSVTVDQGGTYTVTVTDGSQPNCSSIESFTVVDVSESLDFAINDYLNNCEDGGSYIIEIELLSGEGPFDFELEVEGFPVESGQFTDNFTIVTIDVSGAYSLTLTNMETGCAFVHTGELEPLTPFEVEFEVDTAFCAGSTGNIVSTVVSGTEPFSWEWSNGATTSNLTDIPGGIYGVTVTDNNGCTHIEEIYAGNNEEITFSVIRQNADCGENNGTLEVGIITGGTQPWSFEWSTGAATSGIQNLAAGIYSVTVSDAYGCEAVQQRSISNVLPVGIETTQVGEGCEGGLLQLTAHPNGEGFTYNWQGPDGFSADVSSFVAPLEGLYELTVTNSDGSCADSNIVWVESLPDFELLEILVDPAPCFEYTLLTPLANMDIGPAFTHQWVVNGVTVESPTLTFQATEPGTYEYIGTNAVTGCVLTGEVFLATVGGNCNGVVGRLWATQDDCSLNGTQIPVPFTLVRIDDVVGTPVTFATTDAAGLLQVDLIPGTYTAHPLPNAADLFTVCDDVQIFEVNDDASALVDLFIVYEEACPGMFVNLVMPEMDRCFENTAFLYYCNDGPLLAPDASVTVELDPFLVFQSASLPPASIDGNSLTFDLGDLPPFSCGTINLELLVSCEAELGQTHCIEATATPNDPCPAPNDWNGANLVLNAECDGDSLSFFITNNGTAPLSEQLRYVVIEDGIMMLGIPSTGPMLAADEQFVFKLPANGSTYRLEVEQEVNNPAFARPTLVVEGCGVNSDGSFSTGFVNMLPLNDTDVRWYDMLCRQNTGAFDPNDKMGLPLGVNEQRFIKPGTPIVYDIQFQNTGTDTARTVVLRDTIAPEFNLNTLRMGGASHDYSYSIDSNRVLTIVFDNIMLPDSFVNLEASQGVISYYIEHVEGLPLGTELRNQAAIYFDFNEPIFTSNTLHTLGEDFLSSAVTYSENLASLTVFPNPADRNEQLGFYLSTQEAYQLDIFDALGRKIATQFSNNGRLVLDLSQHAKGWYMARATRPDGTLLAVQKFVLN